MKLFKRLIGNDSKQNTVLTNAQIIDILQKEFNMDILYINEIEIDIYLNILKKFLKDWPQWDEFDQTINKLKSQNNMEEIQSMLESNYESLKAYLQNTLSAATPLLRKTIRKVRSSHGPEVMEDDGIVMQVLCTRQQLNELFFRRPHPHYDNNIFNVYTTPSKILVSSFNIESMLNWPSIQIMINIEGCLRYTREMILTLNHVLVNKKLNIPWKMPKNLKTNFQIKGQRVYPVEMEKFLSAIQDIGKIFYQTNEMQQLIRIVCDVIKSDLDDGPKELYSFAMYRRFLSRSPYVRYLYTDVNVSSGFSGNNFDLQLRESGIPQVQFSLSKFQKIDTIPNSGNFLKVRCRYCDIEFSGLSIPSMLTQHFADFHQGEPDWKCTRCKMTFKMEYLAKTKWWHMCDPKLDDDEYDEL